MELRAFVANVQIGIDPAPISVQDAAILLACWHADGVELPDGIIPETLTAEWNRQIS